MADGPDQRNIARMVGLNRKTVACYLGATQAAGVTAGGEGVTPHNKI